MGTRSFDDEIAQVPSRDGADRYFAPNTPQYSQAILLMGVCLKTFHLNAAKWHPK